MISAILTRIRCRWRTGSRRRRPTFQFAVELPAKPRRPVAERARSGARAVGWIRESGSGTKPTPGLRWWQRRRRWLAAAVIAFVIVAGVLAAPFVGSAVEKPGGSAVQGDQGSESDQAFCDGLNEAIAGKLAPLTLANALQTTTARDARARGITTAVDARATNLARRSFCKARCCGKATRSVSITTSSMRPRCDSYRPMRCRRRRAIRRDPGSRG